MEVLCRSIHGCWQKSDFSKKRFQQRSSFNIKVSNKFEFCTRHFDCVCQTLMETDRRALFWELSCSPSHLSDVSHCGQSFIMLDKRHNFLFSYFVHHWYCNNLNGFSLKWLCQRKLFTGQLDRRKTVLAFHSTVGSMTLLLEQWWSKPFVIKLISRSSAHE